jgi:hypothetical protein
MKALFILFMLLFVSPVSAENTYSSNNLMQLKSQLERYATIFLLNSSEAEVEFSYEQRQAICQCKIVLPNRLRQQKFEHIYRYKIVYRKTPDGRLHYQVELESSLNSKFRSHPARV